MTLLAPVQPIHSHRNIRQHENNVIGERLVVIYWHCYYRPQRSCGQGNVFTGVCLSTGGGVCLSACWDAIPLPPDGEPPLGWRTPPWMENHPPPWDGEPPPPGKQTPAYGLRAAGTHPTGMHSCIT